jgi:hypothetical protein
VACGLEEEIGEEEEGAGWEKGRRAQGVEGRHGSLRHHGRSFGGPGKMEPTPWLLSACSRGARPASKQGGGGPRPWKKRACWGGDELGARLLGSHGRPLRAGCCAWEEEGLLAAGKKEEWECKIAQVQGERAAIYRRKLRVRVSNGPNGLGWAGPKYSNGPR